MGAPHGAGWGGRDGQRVLRAYEETEKCGRGRREVGLQGTRNLKS